MRPELLHSIFWDFSIKKNNPLQILTNDKLFKVDFLSDWMTFFMLSSDKSVSMQFICNGQMSKLSKATSELEYLI